MAGRVFARERAGAGGGAFRRRERVGERAREGVAGEFITDCVQCVVFRDAPGAQVGVAVLEVLRELLRDVGFAARAQMERGEAIVDRLDANQALPGSAILPIARTNSAQLARCASTTVRPAGVML